MTAPGKIRAIVLSLALAVSALGGRQDAQAQDGYLHLTSNDLAESRPIRLGVNKSVVVELPRAAGDVLVSNPQIADAVLRTSQRLYLIGVKLGQANVFLFDSAGGQIASFDVFVEADLAGLNQLLAEAIPGGYVRADAMNGNIVLRGQVASASDSSRASEITLGMVEGMDIGTEEGSGAGGAVEKKVVNLLTITGEEQVALKVTIAEVQRDVAKQLGINITGDYNGDDFNIGTSSGDALGIGLSPLPGSSGISASPGEIGLDFTTGGFSIEATLRALDETNMIRTLAEPMLTAVSGETAEFLAGGEFPFRECEETDGDLECSIEFKEFGVKLAFTPVVLAPGRISLKVRTSVSEITSALEGIPVLATNRAETTVEMPSGGAFAIGGMMQSSTRRQAAGFPFLRDLPILGALFSSKDFLESQTELVIIITPYLVKPTSPQNLARPDENLVMSSDAQAYFMNRLTKVYGTAGTAPAGPSAAKVGFSFD